jgi:phosphatidyl-myo-inositol alpha-mannosyltransferase
VKIGLVSPYDWSYPGGVRTHIERLAEELRRRGHHVRIITAATGPQGRKVEYGIYKIGWAMPLRFNGSVARVAILPDINGAVRRLLEQEQFDVIHLHEPMVSMLTLTILRIATSLDIPCVGTFHASSNKRTSTAKLAYRVAGPFLRASFRRLDAYIAVSDAAQSHINRVFRANYHIIPNGIDIEHYSERVEPLPEFNDGKLNVLFMSRMESRKGLRYLLKAIPLVRQQMETTKLPPVRFILASDGPQRERFQRFVQKHGWDDVIFTGYVPDELKRAYFASAAIYCAPSTGNESQGIVLLEAMASGVPVIASDIPGYRTVINNSTYGLLTPPRNSRLLAEAICYLLRSARQRKRIGQAGRKRATTYNWQQVTTEIESVYAEGVAHNRQRQDRYWRIYPPEPTGATSRPMMRTAETSGWIISPYEENVVE